MRTIKIFRSTQVQAATLIALWILGVGMLALA